MDGGMVGLGGLIVLNLIGVAFSYGMTRQELKDHNRRLVRIEQKIDGVPGCKENAEVKR